MSSITTKERFLNYVYPEPNSGCFLWGGALNSKGYGSFYFYGKAELASRVAWWVEYGKWPTQNVLHRCDNPVCVNPSHLFQGTLGDNNRDAMLKGRKNQEYKLSLEEEDRITALYAAGGVTQRRLAEIFGANHATIHRILTGVLSNGNSRRRNR